MNPAHLVGRRIRVQGLGVGKVMAFHRITSQIGRLKNDSYHTMELAPRSGSSRYAAPLLLAHSLSADAAASAPSPEPLHRTSSLASPRGSGIGGARGSMLRHGRSASSFMPPTLPRVRRVRLLLRRRKWESGTMDYHSRSLKKRRWTRSRILRFQRQAILVEKRSMERV